MATARTLKITANEILSVIFFVFCLCRSFASTVP